MYSLKFAHPLLYVVSCYLSHTFKLLQSFNWQHLLLDDESCHCSSATLLREASIKFKLRNQSALSRVTACIYAFKSHINPSDYAYGLRLVYNLTWQVSTSLHVQESWFQQLLPPAPWSQWLLHTPAGWGLWVITRDIKHICRYWPENSFFANGSLRKFTVPWSLSTILLHGYIQKKSSPPSPQAIFALLTKWPLWCFLVVNWHWSEHSAHPALCCIPERRNLQWLSAPPAELQDPWTKKIKQIRVEPSH